MVVVGAGAICAGTVIIGGACGTGIASGYTGGACTLPNGGATIGDATIGGTATTGGGLTNGEVMGAATIGGGA